MIFRDFLPNPLLREYVRKHRIIRFEFGSGTIIPCKAYCPRPETCLIYSFRNNQKVTYPGSLDNYIHYNCTISGMHTVVINRYPGNDTWVLQIVLQPSALFLLTGIPAYEITNTFIDAEAVWGREIRSIHEKMCNSNSIEEVINMAEEFFERLIKRSKTSLLGIDKISSIILNQDRPLSMDQLASDACLSNRQFQRRFTERTGIGPKLFDKVVRFEKAFFMKNANPQLDWLSIALACGYYDYQHLVKDYKYFTHMTPTGFYEVDTKAPERTFGVVEVQQV